MAVISDPERRVIVPGEAPFGPITILVATLLATVAAGGYLVALNWERLYRPDLQRRTLLWGGAGYLIGGLLAIFAYAAAPTPLTIGLILAANAAAGLGLVRWQSPAYAAWITRHGRPVPAQINLRGSLWVLAAIVFVLGCIGLPLIGSTLLPAANHLLPDQTFTAEGLRLVYPRAWTPLDVSADPACQVPATTCLIALRYDSGLTFFDAARVADPGADDASAIAADLWTLAADEAGVEQVALDTFPLGGQTAARLIYRGPASTLDAAIAQVTYWRLIVPQPGGYYRLTIVTGEPLLLDSVDVAAGEGPIGHLLAGLSFDP